MDDSARASWYCLTRSVSFASTDFLLMTLTRHADGGGHSSEA
jgi:hypothetical protein